MKVWMLTGDKVETAACIAISTGIKSKKDDFFYIKDKALVPDYVKNRLEEFAYKHSSVLIIDGDCLEVAVNHYEKLFFTSSMKAPSVVCSRCSPTQKAKIIKLIKKHTDKKICAIGDGGNDVAMIKQAHIGIGVVGKEGLQASLAADYSITKFTHIKILLLWWGRISYRNTATISKFIIHRGLIIGLIQVNIT
jgi:phospholipid-translocating ATPase